MRTVAASHSNINWCLKQPQLCPAYLVEVVMKAQMTSRDPPVDSFARMS